ncbi:hypothetical protein ACQ3I4_13020 [Zafaria sp. Z1313]|uniref:hypothetical protein n=1 Tax=Zafaria sp. Z1313 TaxID=3423202 RepID=UPI003D302A21
MNTDSRAAIRQAIRLLEGLQGPALDQVEVLGEARELLDEALNEAMAHAALEGASIRAVALRAGLSPNAVPPRLARTAPLQAYRSPEGRIGSASLERARYDAELERTPPPGNEPPRFTKRRPSKGGTP